MTQIEARLDDVAHVVQRVIVTLVPIEELVKYAKLVFDDSAVGLKRERRDCHPMLDEALDDVAENHPRRLDLDNVPPQWPECLYKLLFKDLPRRTPKCTLNVTVAFRCRN